MTNKKTLDIAERRVVREVLERARDSRQSVARTNDVDRGFEIRTLEKALELFDAGELLG